MKNSDMIKSLRDTQSALEVEVQRLSVALEQILGIAEEDISDDPGDTYRQMLAIQSAAKRALKSPMRRRRTKNIIAAAGMAGACLIALFCSSCQNITGPDGKPQRRYVGPAIRFDFSVHGVGVGVQLWDISQSSTAPSPPPLPKSADALNHIIAGKEVVK